MQFRHLYTACPLCGSTLFVQHARADSRTHPLFKDGMPEILIWMQCRACSHIFTNGYFTEEALRIVFSGTHQDQMAGANLETQRSISSRMVTRVAKYKAEGAWLDVGFGNGSLVMTAMEFGYDATGLDLRRDNVERMNRLGLPAIYGDITSLDHVNRYSVISMADVLEHIPHPKQALEAAHRLLVHQGIFMVSMPNAAAPIWRILTEARQNPYWGEIEHYHNFTKGRLYDLLQEMRFEPLEYGVSERYRMCMEIIARRLD